MAAVEVDEVLVTSSIYNGGNIRYFFTVLLVLFFLLTV